MTSLSKFVQKVVRYRHKPVTDPLTSASHIQGESIAVGHTYHLESDAQFKRDLEQSLAEIVKKRLQEAEDEAIGLVQVAERTAEANARQIADEILAKANAQAREMVETAKSQVEAIKEAAHEEGFKMGFQEGYADATSQVEQEVVGLLQSAQLLSENAYQAEKLILKNYEKNVVALIGHLARKILHRELSDDSETLLNLVQRAVESLYLSGKIKVVVNPQVLQELRAFSAATESAVSDMSRFEFIVDPLLTVTQIFIVSEEASFDLSLDKQVSQLITPLATAVRLPRIERTEEPDTSASEISDKIQNAQPVAPSDPILVEAESLGLEDSYGESPALPDEAVLLSDSELDKADQGVLIDDLHNGNLPPEPIADSESSPIVKPYHFKDLDAEKDLP
jgi:flagellar assembly protein FliH